MRQIFSYIMVRVIFYFIWTLIAFSPAILHGKEADSLLLLVEKAGEDTAKVYLLDDLTILYLDSLPEKAAVYAGEALLLSRKIGFPKGEGIALLRLGGIEQVKGNYHSASEYYSKAARIFQEHGFRQQLSKAWNSTGIIYYLRADYERSLVFYLKSLEILKEMNDDYGISSLYNNIGVIYNTQRNFNMALKYHFKSLELSRKIENQRGVATSYNNIGEIYRELGQYDEALSYYRKSLEIKILNGNIEGMSYAYGNIGSIFQALGSMDTAFHYFSKCLELREKTGDKFGIATACNSMGGFYLEMKDYSNSIGYFTRGLTTGQSFGAPELIKGAAEGLSNAYSGLGDYKKAYHYHVLFKQQSDSIYKIENMKKITELQMRNEFERLEEKRQIEQQQKEIIRQNEDFRQRIVNYCLIAGIVICAVFVLLVYGNYRSTRRFTALLQEQKKKILQKNEELTNKNEQIQKKTQELEIANLELDKLSIVASNTDNAIIITDETGDFIWVNDSFTRMFEYTLDQITEKSPNICGPTTPEPIRKKFRQCIEKKETVNYEYLASAKSGRKIWVQVTLTPVLDKNNKIVNLVAIDSDITDLKNAEEKIRKQRDILSYQQKEITDSLRYAKRIQSAVLPEMDVILQIFDEYFVLFRPKDIVSGDFYYIVQANNWLVIAVADCTGHGVPGAFMSMLGIAILNEIVVKEYITQASQVLIELRKKVIRALHQKGEVGEQKDGMDIALCAIDTESNRLQFAGANNPLYIIRKNPQDHRIQDKSNKELPDAIEDDLAGFFEVKPDKMPAAIHEKMELFTNHVITLFKGDVLYMFSDGFADQFGGEKGKKFKYKPFKELLLDISDEPMSVQKEILDTTLTGWMAAVNPGTGEHHEQVDDVTVLGLRV